MLQAKSIFAILIPVMLLGLAGCSDKVAEEMSAASKAPARASVQKKSVPSTNTVTLAEAFPGATSNELEHMKACFEAIDNGREAFAMRHARELMDSANADVRLQAIEAFGWIGRFAVNELTEMMADANEDVSFEARRRWEMAFDEIGSEVGRMQVIKKAALLLKSPDSLDVVMMKLSSIEDYDAVRVLCDIITSTNAAPIAVEVARSEYVSLAGEPFTDAKRADQIATIIKNKAEGLAPEPMTKQHLMTQQRKGTK